MIVMERLQNKQGEATRRGGAISVMSVASWPVRAAGCCPSALCRSCRRIGWDDTNGSSRTGGWRDTSQAETTGRKRKVRARSTLGRWPNTALQRIAARWRLWISRTAASGPLALRASVRPGCFDSLKIAMKLLQKHQGGASILGGALRGTPVRCWSVSAVGCSSSTLRRRCQRIGWNDANGRYRRGARRGTSGTETRGTPRAVCAGSALGRWPNPRLQRTRPLWRFLLNVNGSGWGPCR